MNLIINPKDDFDRNFVYSYLPTYMYDILEHSIDYKQIERLNKKFNFNVFDALLYSFKDLEVNEDANSYYISINKNIKLNSVPITQLIKMITFGNLNTRGYPIVNEIFDMTAKYLPQIYLEWKRGR